MEDFVTSLVVQDVCDNKPIILEAFRWTTGIHVDVATNKPLGQRAKLLTTFLEQPHVIPSDHIKLPAYVRKRPNANDASCLVWRPSSGKPKLIRPPKDTTMDMDTYIATARFLNTSPTWETVKEAASRRLY